MKNMPDDVPYPMGFCLRVEFYRDTGVEGFDEGMFGNSRLKCSNVDIEQLRKGIVVEMEHTNSQLMACKIALDHLVEFDNYYDGLEEMEHKLRRMK